MYSFDSRVRYSESDENGTLSLLGMVDYLQDCSTFQSEDLGVGLAHLHAHHLGWFIAFWQIEIERLPRFTDPIVVSTWAYEFTNLYGLRNFTIVDADGSPCVRADSRWFLFDSEQQRPIRLPEAETAPYLTDAEPRLDMPALERKIDVAGPGTPMRAIVVGEQHLDTNHHMNNAQYVKLAGDALPEPFTSGRLSVWYRTAAQLGDTVVPIVHEVPGGHVVDLTDTEGNSFAVVRFENATRS